ncbi:MCE family protein [Williamsia sp. DF01-3]|uniref:MCE family protein n=1 Tax=Williamsia sp. DF01-3 TaxID=2934157 RepID=UPI001FF10552|nr:MCE family protein [Williamsia sp. DF01-3]MCK0516770.1 MCE family protein [Williamsia sp. DF01-3]
MIRAFTTANHSVRTAIAGTSRRTWVALGVIILVLIGAYAGHAVYKQVVNNKVTAYFTETKGIYEGDSVLFLGVKVGAIDSITPEPSRVKVTFHYNSEYKVPAGAKVVVLSPSLVTARAIQMTPGYSGGPTLPDGAVVGLDRTAVPVEWDDFRKQLERLGSALSPTPDNPNGSLGRFIEDAGEALDGKGEQINNTLTKLSDAVQTFAGSRDDIFTIIKGLEKFVTALASSEHQIVAFNGRLASITSALDNSHLEVSNALGSVDQAVGKLTTFLADNKDRIGTSLQDLSGLSETLKRSQGDIEALLHTAPTAFANFVNIYQPAQGVFTGALAFTNFQNPIQFICGAIQSASRMNAQDAARLCVEKLGPLLSMVAINYPPVGVNPIVGVQTRPGEVDYSEEWLRRLTTSDKTPTGGGS